MNVSLYQAAAALDGNVKWQQMLAENLAASSTPGFKKNEISFATVQAGALGIDPNSLNGQKNPTILPRPVFGTNFTPGEMKATQVKSDVALEGPGFLTVQFADGSTAFTRDGEFHIDLQGRMVNKANLPLLGEGNVPIQVDPRGGPESISISQEGGVVSQAGLIRGRLSLTEFQDRSELVGIGNGYYVPKPNAQSAPATSTLVMQGFLETSNVVPTVEVSSLLLALRHFEANQRVIQMQDERMGRLIQELSATS